MYGSSQRISRAVTRSTWGSIAEARWKGEPTAAFSVVELDNKRNLRAS